MSLSALWEGLRLVVIDTETTETPDGSPRRCVSVAAVTCRAATVRSRWQRLVDPGVPIDAFSRRVHHITDEHLEGEPDFPTIAGELLGLLAPHQDERVVLVAHNAKFDVGVLRYELQQAGYDLPDVPVLDTMGRLIELAGIEVGRRRLGDVAAAVGVTNAAEHDALGDAQACAEIALALLDRAAARGHTDLDALLRAVGSRTSRRFRPGGTSKPRRATPEPTEVPATHAATHATVLPGDADTAQLTVWRDAVAECAALRCPHLTERVAQSALDRSVLLGELHIVLDATIAAGDTAAAATLLEALLPLLDALPPRKGRLGRRNALLAWAKQRGPAFTALGRCGGEDACPACQRLEPCPLDLWPDTVGALALGDPQRYARGFFEMTGREAGTGAYTSWLKGGIDPRVADTALWICVQEWRRQQQHARAEQVVELGWHAGSRHPDLVDAYAGALAAPGRITHLDAALGVCSETLAQQAGSTHDSWRRLASRRNQLAGRRQRLLVKPSGQFDPDGNPIPTRRHHPTNPRRTRPPRFVDR